MTAAQARTTMAADRVNFVDEDDAGCVFLSLLEKIAHAAGANTDEHLHEIRTGNREEGDIGFAGNRPGQQSLTCSRRSFQQYAFGDAPTEFLELLRFAQELDDLTQLFFGFIYTGHIFERDLFLLHGEQTRPAFAK